METVIVGAGVSGLGCARTLYEHGKEFKIISENIGGRILPSKNGKVNYGAYFFGEDYTHVKSFLKRKRKISLLEMSFHSKRERYSSLSIFFYPLQGLRLLNVLRRFTSHYKIMKRKCLNQDQKKVIKEDPYLYYLYTTKADKFIKDNNIFDICDRFLNEAFYALSFCETREVYAYEYLRWMQYLIFPVWEFEFLENKITKGFKQNIIIDSVESISKGTHFVVKTKDQMYHAKNVVIATPPHITQKLLGLKKIKTGTNVYMFHISGVLKEQDQEKYELFHERTKIHCIAQQEDGSYLIYSKDPKINLRKYFKTHKIITKKYWNPAFNIKGRELISLNPQKNLYLIGDVNACGLEDSYITGIYAANQIIKNNKKSK